MTSVARAAEATLPGGLEPGAPTIPRQVRRSVVTAVADPVESSTERLRRTPVVVLEVVGAVVAASVSVLVVDGRAGSVAATGAWLLLAYSRVPGLRGHVQRRLEPLWRAAVTVLAASAGVAALLGPGRHLTAAVTAVLSAATAAGVIRAVAVRRAGPVRVVLVGDGDLVGQCLSRWRSRRDVRIVGSAVIAPPTASSGASSDTSSTTDGSVTKRSEQHRAIADLPRLVESVGAELVTLVPGPGLDSSAAGSATRLLEHTGVPLVVLGPFSGIDHHRLTPRPVAGEAGCEVDLPHRSALGTALKHGIDRLVAALLLVLLTPVLVLLALAVKMESAGPAFFTQVRIGHHGRPFRIHKVRTMVVDAEERKRDLLTLNEADGALFKMRRDPRATRIGCFLRRTSLDELPQLVNVVRGEMSLIGPRPFIPSEIATMDASALRRLVVRPGMTGLWQVSGRSDLSWEDSIALDVRYIDNWSLPGDLRIAARTVVAVASGRGAC